MDLDNYHKGSLPVECTDICLKGEENVFGSKFIYLEIMILYIY